MQCQLKSLAVGGQITGLKGQGLLLSLNQSEVLSANSSSNFQFTQPVASGQRYEVNVVAQPKAPAQVCSASRNTGLVANQVVEDVQIVCADVLRRVVGQVIGLLGAGLSLQLNAEPSATVSSGGRFEFPTPLADQSGYQITVKTQPQGPSQVCSISNGSGYATVAQETDPFIVSCATAAFSVGGTVSGLKGRGLILQNNGSDDLIVDKAGFFSFAQRIPSGARYTLSVRQQPSNPYQVCNTASTDTVHDAPVNDAQVTCVDVAYPVSISVDGLGGQSLVLQNNGGEDLLIQGDGESRFKTPIAAGASYSVTFKQGPAEPMLSCVFDQRDTISGRMPDSGLSTLRIHCRRIAPQITYTVHGLLGDRVGIFDRFAGTETATRGGQYTFPSTPPTGEQYAISVWRNPISPAQLCTVTNGTGTMTDRHVTNVAVECGAPLAPLFRIGSRTDYVSVERLDPKTGAALMRSGKQVVDPGASSFIRGIASITARPAGRYINIYALQGSLIHTLRFDTDTEQLTTIGAPLQAGHPSQPFYLRLSPDGRFLFVTSVGQYGHVRLVVDSHTGTLSDPSFVSSVLSNELTFNSQGTRVYSVGGWLGATVYDAGTGTFSTTASDVLAYGPIAISPNGKWILATGSNRDVVAALALDTSSGGALLNPAPVTLLTNVEVSAIALSRAGSAALVAYQDRTSFKRYIKLLKLNPDTGQLVQQSTPLETTRLTQLTIDPTERFALSSVDTCDSSMTCETKRFQLDMDEVRLIGASDSWLNNDRFVIIDTSISWSSAANAKRRPSSQR